MSGYEYPPFPCCGGLTFHKGGDACDAYLHSMQFNPSPFRFTWRTTRVVRAEDVVPGERQGRAFRGARVEFGLTLREVAHGWRLSDVEVGELERGLRRFIAPADLHAALQQLWCWGCEKNQELHT